MCGAVSAAATGAKHNAPNVGAAISAARTNACRGRHARRRNEKPPMKPPSSKPPVTRRPVAITNPAAPDAPGGSTPKSTPPTNDHAPPATPRPRQTTRRHPEPIRPWLVAPTSSQKSLDGAANSSPGRLDACSRGARSLLLPREVVGETSGESGCCQRRFRGNVVLGVGSRVRSAGGWCDQVVVELQEVVGGGDQSPLRPHRL